MSADSVTIVMIISPLAEYWIWFTSCFGMNGRVWDVVSKFESVKDAYLALNDRSIAEKILTQKELHNISSTSLEHAKVIVNDCFDKDIGIISFDDNNYPSSLKSVYNPPCHLFYKGDISCLEENVVLSVVGARRPSEYSIAVTSALVKNLVSYGIAIASGFAKGIDITSHLSCISAGGKTAAILGCGINYDYPADNIVHRDTIINNGVMISEYYPNAAPSALSFPQRNRILSGLSLGTIVIEAGEKSGSLVTANLALSQGKDIFCIPPHNIFDKRYSGNIGLLRDGAIPIFGIRDILYEYYENYSHKLTEKKMASVMITEFTQNNDDTNNIAAEHENIQANDYAHDFSSLSEEETAIAEILSKSTEPVIADDIAAILSMEISDVLALLTDLEIEGIAENCGGQSYKLK